MCCLIMLLMAVIGAVLIPVLITKLWKIWKLSLGNIKHGNKFIGWFCYPTFVWLNLINNLLHWRRVQVSLTLSKLSTEVRYFIFFCYWAVRLPWTYRFAILFVFHLFCCQLPVQILYLIFVFLILLA